MLKKIINLNSIYRYYAAVVSKKKGKGVAATVKKAERPVETNPEILANYCCINYRINESPIKLKENHEYPDWLWKLHIGSSKPISDLEENTQEYWDRVRAVNFKELSRLAKRDGWYKKSHQSRSFQLSSFYGNKWCNLIDDYEKKHGSLLDEPAIIEIDSENFQGKTLKNTKLK